MVELAEPLDQLGIELAASLADDLVHGCRHREGTFVRSQVGQGVEHVGGNPRGVREYFKVDWLGSLPDEAIDAVVAQAERLPAPFGQLILAPMGGAVSDSPSRDMALNVVDAPWLYFCLAMWMDPTEDDQNRAWARGFGEAMRGFGVGTAFSNFIEPDEGDRLRASFGEEKFARLVECKRRWDPQNLFRLNQNIPV